MQTDDRDAVFAQFAENARRPLTHLALALTNDRTEADDLVQETLMRVMNRWREVPVEHPFAYARTALVRAHISEHRRPHHRRECLDGTSGTDAPLSGHSHGAASLEDEATDRAVLRKALAAMPLRQRQVVVLRYLEDMSIADVAEVLGCSTGSVKRSTHTGLLALRRAFGNADQQDPTDTAATDHREPARLYPTPRS